MTYRSYARPLDPASTVQDRPLTVAPRNLGAARTALRLFAAVTIGTVLYHLLGGDSAWPLVAAVSLAPLLWLAARNAVAVEVREDGLVRRGLFRTRVVPWDQIRAITWRRHAGVESYRARAGLGSVEISSDRVGYLAASRRLCTIARFRGIAIGL